MYLYAISRERFYSLAWTTKHVGPGVMDDFETFVKSCDVILLGRRTFEIMTAAMSLWTPEYIVVTEDEKAGLRYAEAGNLNSRDMPHARKVGIIGVVG